MAPDGELRLSPRLVFSTVGERTTVSRSVTVRNPGAVRRHVTALAITGNQASAFRIANPPALPAAIPAYTNLTLSIAFRPQSPTLHFAKLVITTDDPAAPTLSVQLTGVDSFGYNGNNEPTLNQVLTGLGYTTYVGTTGRVIGTTRAAVGEERLSPFWRAADPSQPVGMFPIARYVSTSPQDRNSAGWFTPDGTRRAMFAFPFTSTLIDPAGGENQKLMPSPCNPYVGVSLSCSGTGARWFSPSGQFGLYFGLNFSDDTRNRCTTCPGTVYLHNWRFFPARGSGHVRIQNAWLATLDVKLDRAAKNWDYRTSSS
jgi:hypothetical protein